MEKLGVAVVGLDHWYWAFDLAQNAAQGELTKLVAVADANAARADEVSKRTGAPALTDLRAAIEHPDAQIVAITTSTDLAPELIKQAAAAGKHILGVKPFALDMETADSLVDAVTRAGVQYFPLESGWRLSPERIRQRQWVVEGRIGRPVRYSQTMHVGLPQAWPGSTESGWWLDPNRVPGGGWLDHAIYALDYARWVFGSEPVNVTGVAGARRHTELPLEDYGVATYDFASGQTAVIEDTWTADQGASFSRSELVGTAGSICDDSSAWGKIAVRGDFGHSGWLALEPARGPMHAVTHLAEAVRDGKPTVATVADARANLAGCLAFYRVALAAQRLSS
jgi:predicted dehydrogenase